MAGSARPGGSGSVLCGAIFPSKGDPWLRATGKLERAWDLFHLGPMVLIATGGVTSAECHYMPGMALGTFCVDQAAGPAICRSEPPWSVLPHL